MLLTVLDGCSNSSWAARSSSTRCDGYLSCVTSNASLFLIIAVAGQVPVFRQRFLGDLDNILKNLLLHTGTAIVICSPWLDAINALVITTSVLYISEATLPSPIKTAAERLKSMSRQVRLALKTEWIETLLAVLLFTIHTVQTCSKLPALWKVCCLEPLKLRDPDRYRWRTKEQCPAVWVHFILHCPHQSRCR